ncbi:MAG TPA: methyltransferase, partial [Blastocatellia bacterium]|nr:methyltransferase [Blastocatellia bacterium]
LDLVLMPLARPVLELSHSWLVGEAVAIGVCLIPAQLLARWTEMDVHVRRRAALQALAFTGISAGVLPVLILSLTGGSTGPLLARPFWLNSLYIQLLAAPIIIGSSAVQEFASRGHGTPLPLDPPVRLVRTGLYRYAANPMQASILLGFLCGGLILASWWVAAAGIVAFSFSAGFAWWNESGEMAARFRDSWTSYRSGVQNWIPRWRPLDTPSATIYVASGCPMCQGVGGWIARRNPRGLVIAAAEFHPARRLTRITYECEGYVDEGVAAFARAMEHINAGWALAGSAMRLPIVRACLQLVVDVSGGGALQISWNGPGHGSTESAQGLKGEHPR